MDQREMLNLVDSLNEDEAIRLICEVSDRFGWATAAYTRNDVSSIWEQTEGAPEFTDQHWETFVKSYTWRHLFDTANEYIWEAITQEVSEQIEQKV